MVTVFEQGDIVYLDFDPQAGHEQRGRRPALVVSNNLFNRVSSLTMVCRRRWHSVWRDSLQLEQTM